MSDILRRRYEELERYLSELGRELDLKLVILFGSLARGDWMESSDIDLLIVSDDLSDDPAENFIRLKRGRVEPHGYSTRRFLEELEKPNLLILDALEYGERLVVDDEFMRVVESKREEVKRRYGLKWVDGAWTWRIEY
ncbi:MAG: nucleotidyltransferase domain-containing protein [Nitrososphaerota archaeon]